MSEKYSNKCKANQIFHYTRCITPKRVIWNSIANTSNSGFLIWTFFKQKNAGEQLIFRAKFNFINLFFGKSLVLPQIILGAYAHVNQAQKKTKTLRQENESKSVCARKKPRHVVVFKQILAWMVKRVQISFCTIENGDQRWSRWHNVQGQD